MGVPNVFDLMADKIMGTNLTGHNARGGLTFSKEQVAEIQRHLDNYESLSAQHKALIDKFNELTNQTNKEIDTLKSKLFSQKCSIEILNSESRRISQKNRTWNFIETRAKAYLSSIGIDRDTAAQALPSLLNRNQIFTYNLYLLASADWMVIETAIHDYIIAISEVFNDFDDGLISLSKDEEQVLENIRSELITASAEINQYDSQIFPAWFKERVSQYAQCAKIKDGLITLVDLPAVNIRTVSSIHITPELLATVRSKMSGNITEFIDFEDLTTLFTPGYKSKAAFLNDALLPF